MAEKASSPPCSSPASQGGPRRRPAAGAGAAIARSGPRAFARSYGRKRGRSTSARQLALLERLLPTLAIQLDAAPPPRLAEALFRTAQDVWLEIGFGGGEHLLWQARANPAIGFIGCEPFQDGLIKALSAIERERLANIRLYAEDARYLLEWLPPASIGRAFLLFPDPWPKRRHHKRRLVSVATLGELARILRPGSQLRIATDIGEYARSISEAVARQGSFACSGQSPAPLPLPQPFAAFSGPRPADWPPTRYEQKALREGRQCNYFCFWRR